MKNSFFQKNKNILSIVAAIIAFAVITLVYFSPVLQGKRIKQHDIEMHLGMSQEITEYRNATGEETLWTNAHFCSPKRQPHESNLQRPKFGFSPPYRLRIHLYVRIFRPIARA